MFPVSGNKFVPNYDFSCIRLCLTPSMKAELGITTLVM